MENEKFAFADTSPLVLVPFSDPLAFAEAILKVQPEGLLAANVRVIDLEIKDRIDPGYRRTPFVLVMVRDKDEFLMLKLIGQTYDYWGEGFSDHAEAHEKALEWMRKVKIAVFELIEKLELNHTTNSYYYHPHIRNAVGIHFSPDEKLIDD